MLFHKKKIATLLFQQDFKFSMLLAQNSLLSSDETMFKG
jgi:hypothetical protein